MTVGDLFDARALALGIVAMVNPCGFAMLPAYLGFFLGIEAGQPHENRLIGLQRAQKVALAMSAGFMLVFGLIGVVLAGAMNTVAPWLPWITLLLGVGLVALGVAMSLGYEPNVRGPKLEKGGRSQSLTSMFLFGVSYAVASLSCTISLFISAVGTSAAGHSFGQRLGGFLSYAIGMGLTATVVTLAVAFGRRGVVQGLRQVLPHLTRISAVILIVVGVYVAWYGYWSTDPAVINPGPITWVEARQAELSTWISDRATMFGVTFLAVNLAVLAGGTLARRAQAPRRPAPSGH
ncbi:MAG: cytochrome c biogenesis CcdA family protein [Acidimicrobiales bacterium]